MPLTFDASPDELRFFLEEAEEQFQILDDGLLELERDGAQENLLQDIFRAAHTLKGSSATIGHARMAELTHQLEDILDRLRKGSVAISRELIDACFEALDALRLLNDEVATLQESTVDIAPLLQRLAQVPDGAASRPVDIYGPGSSTRFRLDVGFEREHPLAAARALQLILELAAYGKVVETTPDRAAIEREQIGGSLTILVEWPDDRESLERLLRTTPDITSFSVETTRETRLARQDEDIVAIAIEFDAANELRAARAMQLLLQLQSVGSVLASTPTMAEIEQQHVATSMEVHFAWDRGRAELEALLSAAPDIVAFRIEAVDGATLDTPGLFPPAGGNGERLPELRRAPGAANTIRMSVERIDRMLDYIGELVIERSRISESARILQATIGESGDIERLIESTNQVEFLISQIHEEMMMGRMLPIESVLGKFPRLVRDLAQSLDKQIEFTLDCGEVELDRSVIEAISDPLIHIVRNAVDHGIESPDIRASAGKPPAGNVTITARQVENRIVVTVSDDGKGINPDILRASAVEAGLLDEEAATRLSDSEAVNLIFQSGFTTAAKVTDVSGRGVGMDIVRRSLERIGASIEIASRPGSGSTFTIRLPLTLAIIRALLVRCEGWSFAIPLDSVIETVRLSDMHVHAVGRQRMMRLRDRILPLMHLSESLERGARADDARHGAGFAVVLNSSTSALAVLVDELIGEQEIVVKPLGSYIPQVPGITGATILGDGSFALIVDAGKLASLEGAVYDPARAA